MDNIDYFSPFPSFASNREYMMVVGKEKEFEEIRQKIIAEIQADCQHDFIPKYKQLVLFSPEILESKTCKHCGFQQEKPAGNRLQICEKCWAEMKLVSNEKWRATYKCVSCNYLVSHEQESL
ncbi:MAG: hypothetical protein RI945_132 [Candidatus Parcubacteria bacterium]|jgi:hypothetical protein